MASNKRSEVTPAFLRTLMPQGPSPEDQLYRKKQQEIYRIMELAARQNLYEASFTVVDADVEDERMLDLVHERLMRWLTRPKDERNAFCVKPSSKALRSFVVSWDPVETPRSITETESQDPHSATYHRLKRHSYSFASQQKEKQQQQQQQRFQTAHLAPPSRSQYQQDESGAWSPWFGQVPFDWNSGAAADSVNAADYFAQVSANASANLSASRAAQSANKTAGSSAFEKNEQKQQQTATNGTNEDDTTTSSHS